MQIPAEKLAQEALKRVPGIPCSGEAPVFAEPWQAQAFAIALSLQQRGVFTWGEWAETLGLVIKDARTAGDPDDGSTYYLHWMTALERVVARKELASVSQLESYARAWGHAADRTAHGHPIELRDEDFQ